MLVVQCSPRRAAPSHLVQDSVSKSGKVNSLDQSLVSASYAAGYKSFVLALKNG